MRFQWLHIWLQVLIIARLCIGDALFFQRLTEDKLSITEINITIFQQLIQNTKPGPRTEDLNNKMLLEIMGDLFDQRYHSIIQPADLEKIFTDDITEEMLLQLMPEKLRSEKFKLSEINTDLKLHTQARNYFQIYLQHLSHCPLEYKWKDLGELVWPRYFKVTSCQNKPCSYPPGMNCIADEIEQVALLYWNCHARVKKSGTRKCGWSVFKIKVISKCKCSCQQNE